MITMTLQTKLEKIENALTSIDDLSVYHYLRPKLSAPYCVWQEDSENDALQSDNHKDEQSIYGSVDYFTKEEYDAMADAIQEALNNTEGVYWTYNSVQYEEDTELIHHEWTWSVI